MIQHYKSLFTTTHLFAEIKYSMFKRHMLKTPQVVPRERPKVNIPEVNNEYNPPEYQPKDPVVHNIPEVTQRVGKRKETREDEEIQQDNEIQRDNINPENVHQDVLPIQTTIQPNTTVRQKDNLDPLESYYASIIGIDKYNNLKNETIDDMVNKPVDPLIVQTFSLEQPLQNAKDVLHNISEAAGEIADNLGINIQKSEELTKELNEHLKKTQSLLDLVNKYKWYAGTSLGLMTVMIFIFKMGYGRVLLDGAKTVISHLPSVSPSKPAKDTGERVFMDTAQDLLGTPLTPIGIMTGVGATVTLVTLLRAALWATRFIKKIK